MTPTQLGSLLRKERIAQGLSQEHLAARVGVTRQTVIALESGRAARGATLLAVLTALGLTIAQSSFGGDSEPSSGRPTIKDLLRRRRQEVACED